MKKLGMFIAVALAAACVLAQDGPRRGMGEPPPDGSEPRNKPFAADK